MALRWRLLRTLWLPKIASGLAQLPRWATLIVGMIDLLKLLGGLLVGVFRSHAAREADGISPPAACCAAAIPAGEAQGAATTRLDNVTANPTAEWIARQITEAFPWDEAPRDLIRDRDTSYGAAVTRRLRAMGIRDRPITPRSPWQNGHVERLIGSIRRECLDHVVVLGERHLRHLLANYAAYYNGVRTHLALDKDTPLHRPA